MPSRKQLALRANVLGLDHTTIPNDSKLEQKVIFLENNATAFTGTAATGVLTSDNTNVSDGDTVTIGSQVYTFKTALTAGTANQVLIGASADASLTNLVSAINGAGTAGTDYTANTPVNKDVTAGAVASHATTLTAINYAARTNADVATTETSAHLSFGGATLSGGVAKIIAPSDTQKAAQAGGVNH